MSQKLEAIWELFIIVFIYLFIYFFFFEVCQWSKFVLLANEEQIFTFILRACVFLIDITVIFNESFVHTIQNMYLRLMHCVLKI